MKCFQRFVELTQKLLHDPGVSEGEHEGVGGGLQVRGVGIDLLDVNIRDGVDLSHEQDKVARIDVVAETVDDEEEVAPVLCRLHGEGSWLQLLLLILLFYFLCLRLFLSFLLVLLGNLLRLLILLFLGFFLWFVLLGFFFEFVLLGFFLGFFLLGLFSVFRFSSRFGFNGFSLFLGLLGFFLFSPEGKKYLKRRPTLSSASPNVCG